MSTTTVDEIIINFVRENQCLYDKKNVDFKNTTKKKDLWKIISDDLKKLYDINMPADSVEKRWSSLRDQFSREHRKQKLPPSGSGYNSTKEWELYRVMLFLAPHIAHRRTKTSLSLISCPSPSPNYPETEIEESNDSLSSKHPSISNSPTAIIDDSYSGSEESVTATNIQNVQNKQIEILSRPSSVLSTCSSSSSSQFPTTSTNCNSKNVRSSFLCKPVKKAMPELDNFAKRRKINDQLINQELSEASSAISNAVNSVLHFSNQKESKDGYMLAVEEGLKHVPDKNKTQCLIEVLQIIKKYEER